MLIPVKKSHSEHDLVTLAADAQRIRFPADRSAMSVVVFPECT